MSYPLSHKFAIFHTMKEGNFGMCRGGWYCFYNGFRVLILYLTVILPIRSTSRYVSLHDLVYSVV